MNDEDTKYAGYLGVLSRRRLLKQAAIGGVALGAAALIGCGDDDDDDDDAGTASPIATTAPGTPTATATPAAATKRGGYFKGILFSGYSKPSIDLYTVGGGSIYTLYGKLWYESLIDPDFSLVEWLTALPAASETCRELGGAGPLDVCVQHPAGCEVPQWSDVDGP